MDIILLERVENLGQIGDIVTVKPGFARNFLFPQRKALRATKENKAHFEARKAQLEADNLKRRSEAEDMAKRMEGLTVSLIRSAAESGQLYGSVTTRDIASVISDAGFKVVRNQIKLNHTIKTLGLFDIPVALHPEVKIEVKINVARSEEEALMQIERGGALVGGPDEQDEDEEILAAAPEAETEAQLGEAEAETTETEDKVEA